MRWKSIDHDEFLLLDVQSEPIPVKIPLKYRYIVAVPPLAMVTLLTDDLLLLYIVVADTSP